jgi:flagellar P-ring protein precursor FlgI
MKRWISTVLAVAGLAMALLPTTARADRIKDLTTVAAKRTNQLIGYGLVVGLQGTGDGADVSFTAQSMKAMLGRMGVALEGALADFETASSGGKMDIKNVAAVMITAELPGFAKPGQKIDINVSARH